jgi:hypothetical protein
MISRISFSEALPSRPEMGLPVPPSDKQGTPPSSLVSLGQASPNLSGSLLFSYLEGGSLTQAEFWRDDSSTAEMN